MDRTTFLETTIDTVSRNARAAWGDSGTGWRVISISVSLLFFHFYSKALFVVFMGKEGFFSYDLFIGGGIGMEVFFATAELMMIVLSISLFGVAIPIVEWIYKKQRSWRHLLFFGALNFLMLGIFGWGVYKSKVFGWYDCFVIVVLGLFIVAHIATVAHRTAKQSLRTLLVLLILVSAFTAIVPDNLSRILKLGLAVYGVGGDVPVVVTDKANSSREGKLVFLSPENVYIRFDESRGITILRRGEQLEIEIRDKKSRKA